MIFLFREKIMHSNSSKFCISCKVFIEEKKIKNENIKSSLKVFIKVKLNSLEGCRLVVSVSLLLLTLSHFQQEKRGTLATSQKGMMRTNDNSILEKES